MVLDVFETLQVCVFPQGLPIGLHSVLAVIKAGEPLDNTVLVRMKNHLPVRNRLDRFHSAYDRLRECFNTQSKYQFHAAT